MKNKCFIVCFLFLSAMAFALDESASLLDVAINDYKKGQYSFAINNLTKYLQIGEQNQNKSVALYYLSLSYYFTNNYKMSLKNFNELINKYRSSSYASISHFWIGLIYQNSGKWDEAGQSFEKYISLYPHSDIVDKAYFAYANCLLAQNKEVEAGDVLKELVTKHKKSDKYEEGNVLYAYILIKNNKKNDAEQFLQDWVRKLGENGGNFKYKDRFWLYLSEILLEEENLIEAKVFLKKIDIFCQNSPSSDIALLRLAYIANKLGNEKEARQYVFRLNTEYPNSKYNVDATLFMGMIELDKQQYQDAIVYFENAIDVVERKKVNNEISLSDDEINRLKQIKNQAKFYIGDTYEKLNNVAKAYEVFNEIVEENDSIYASNSVLRVINLMSTKQVLDKSNDEIYQYISMHSSKLENDVVLRNKFLLYKARYELALQKYTECVETCEKISDEKLIATVGYLKSSAYIHMDMKVQAREFLQQCFDKVGYDEKIDLAFEIMNLYFNEGNYNQALRYYRIILTYGKNANADKDTSDLFVRTGYLCGLTYLQLKDNKHGIEILKNVIEKSKLLNLSNTSKKMLNQVYYYLGWLYYRDSDFENATKNFAISSTLDIDSELKKDSFYMEAWSYFSNKEYANAVRCFEKMYKAYGDTDTGVLALFHSAKCYENLKNVGKAIEIYTQLADSRKNNAYKANSIYELVKYALEKKDFVVVNDRMSQLQKIDLDFYSQALLLQAQTFLSLGRFSEAYSIYNYYLREFYNNNDTIDQNKKDSICYWAGYCASKNNDEITTIELLSNIKRNSSFYAEALMIMIEIFNNNGNLIREKQFITEVLPYLEDNKQILFYKQRLNEIALVESGYSKEEADLTLKASSGTLENKFDLALFYIKNTNAEDLEKGLALMKEISEQDKSDVGAKANIAIADVYFDNNKFEDCVKIYFNTAKSYSADKKVISEALYKTAYCYYRLNKTKLFDSIVEKLKTDFPDEVWTEKVIDLQKRVRE